VLAAVLGAEVGPAPVPELGWRVVETDDPAVIPEGPWLEWHFERFCTPPGATELARTATRRRRSGSARTSGCSSTPRRRWRSWGSGRGPTGARTCRWPPPPEQLAAARSAAFRLFDGFVRSADLLAHHLPSSA
jgi:hypothetical protein